MKRQTGSWALCLCLLAFCFTSPGRAAEPVASTTPKSPMLPVLQTLVEKQIVAGAVVAVVDRTATRSVATIGCESVVAQQAMRPEALFWIASMTKPITGTALMMLVDEGKLSLDDPIEKHLPEFRGQMVAAGADKPAHAPAHPITVREVMNHTSGLVLANDPIFKGSYSLQDRTAKAASLPLLREPGTKYEYNNTGINTAGRVIEVVSGMPYAEFMQRRVFDPLGMRDTTFWPNVEQASRLAHSYRRKEGSQELEEINHAKGITPDLLARLGRGVKVPEAILADMGHGQLTVYAERYAEPAGGLFSTAGDLASFCRMLLNGGVHDGRRLLSEKAIAAMSADQTGAVPVNPQEAYGVGWSVKLRDDEGPSVGSFGHRGARRPCMWIDPKHGLAVIILVERVDMSGDEQKQLYGPVLKAAIKAYGASSAKQSGPKNP